MTNPPIPLAPADRTCAVRCGALLDGVGGRWQDVGLLIAGDRVLALQPWAEISPSRFASVLDCGGATVMPGLIDAHDHVATPPRDPARRSSTPPSLFVLEVAESMRATLRAGFTTVRDMGGLDLGFKMAVESGALAGPRVRICLNILTQTAGLSDPTNAVGISTEWLRLPGTPDNVTDGPDNLRAMVRRYVRGGADFIKIATTGGVSSRVSGIASREFTFAEVEAVVAEARALGRSVAAHAYAGEGLKNALRAGVRSVEHLGPLDDDDIAMIVRQGTFVVPTLLNMHVRRQPHIAETLSAFSRGKAEELAPLQPEIFRRLHRAGARIAAGTDSRPFEQGGNARELALLVQFGMTPMEAIAAATSVAADCCELPDVGRLAPGMRGDFLAVEGDPLADIEVLTSEDRVRLVCRDGIVFKDIDGRAGGRPSRGSLGI